MAVQSCPYVFLKIANFTVGTAKYFLDPETSTKRRRIDGEDLSSFCKDEENLVAVYHVQIYRPYEKMLYPYRFGGPEDPPKFLSELNTLCQSFKRIVAWDENAVESNPNGTDLGDVPVQLDRPRVTSIGTGSELLHARNEDQLVELDNEVVPTMALQEHTATASVTLPSRSRNEVEEAINEGHRDSLHIFVDETNGTSSTEIDSVPSNDSDDEEDIYAMEAVDEIIKEIIEECSPEEAEWRKAALTEKKRKYTYRNRTRAVKKPKTDLQKRRIQMSNRSDNPFLLVRACCRRFQCFATVDPDVSFAFYKKTMGLCQEARKEEIIRLLHWETKTFHMDGRPVCAAFLDDGFSISRCLQSTVKGTEKSKGTQLPFRLPRETKQKTMKDRIINYLRLLAGQDGQHMPHETRTNLPFPRRGDVYDAFVDYLARGDEDGEVLYPPTRSYFNRVWRKYVPHVTVRKPNDFTVCARCEWLRSKMVYCFRKRDHNLMFRLKRELREHTSEMKAERRSYDERKMLAINHPSQYCSIVVDGADQKNYGLPHFMYSVKTDRGHAIKIKCVGVLEHLKNKRLSLFTMTEEFESGANHVIECIHRVLQKKKTTNKSLPPVLFVQMDNCTRENKNRYMMCYLESLVATGVFTEVQISFLPIGHTHSDIDQAFGCVARRLSLVDAATMDDLLKEMRQSYNPKAMASEVLRVANFSGMCEETKCLQKISGFSEYRYFRFIRSETQATSSSQREYLTACHVKRYLEDPWTELGNDAETGGVFMKVLPDLRRTPHTVTKVPDDIEEIEKRLDSVEVRVENPDKMRLLRELKNRIYESRSDAFHWNIDSCFELNGDYLPAREEEVESPHSENSDDDEEEAVLNYDYVENEFVAVKPPENATEPFWVAMVINIHKRDRSNRANKLLVRWFTPKRPEADPFSATYCPAFKTDESKTVPYSSILHVNTVMVKFPSLSAKKKLYVDTQRNIRDCLNSM